MADQHSGSDGGAHRRAVPVTVRVTPYTLQRFVLEARAQGTSPARLMREALQNSAKLRAAAQRRASPPG